MFLKFFLLVCAQFSNNMQKIMSWCHHDCLEKQNLSFVSGSTKKITQKAAQKLNCFCIVYNLKTKCKLTSKKNFRNMFL